MLDPVPQLRVSRGVYRLPYSGRQGERYLALVDHDGRRIYEATVYSDESVEEAEEAMWRVLDEEDPPLLRSLRLI